MPWRNSIGTPTPARCRARSVPISLVAPGPSPIFFGGWSGKPTSTIPSTSSGALASAWVVIRPPIDLPPAKVGNPSARPASTAARTVASSTGARSGRFLPASVKGNW